MYITVRSDAVEECETIGIDVKVHRQPVEANPSIKILPKDNRISHTGTKSWCMKNENSREVGSWYLLYLRATSWIYMVFSVIVTALLSLMMSMSIALSPLTVSSFATNNRFYFDNDFSPSQVYSTDRDISTFFENHRSESESSKFKSWEEENTLGACHHNAFTTANSNHKQHGIFSSDVNMSTKATTPMVHPSPVTITVTVTTLNGGLKRNMEIPIFTACETYFDNNGDDRLVFGNNSEQCTRDVDNPRPKKKARSVSPSTITTSGAFVNTASEEEDGVNNETITTTVERNESYLKRRVLVDTDSEEEEEEEHGENNENAKRRFVSPSSTRRFKRLIKRRILVDTDSEEEEEANGESTDNVKKRVVSPSPIAKAKKICKTKVSDGTGFEEEQDDDDYDDDNGNGNDNDDENSDNTKMRVTLNSTSTRGKSLCKRRASSKTSSEEEEEENSENAKRATRRIIARQRRRKRSGSSSGDIHFCKGRASADTDFEGVEEEEEDEDEEYSEITKTASRTIARWVVKRQRIKGDRNWEAMFNLLLEYKQKKGDTAVPLKYDIDPELGNWVSNQRKEHRMKTLSDRQTRMLGSIGFAWKVREQDDTWMGFYKRLVAYKEQHGGSTSVPRRYPEDSRLGAWVNRQRSKFRKNELLASQIDLFNSIDFSWTQNSALSDRTEKRWMENYRKLLAFKETHNGSTTVPCQGDLRPLGYWLKEQRRKLRENRMPKDRADLLFSIGVVRDAQKERDTSAWMFMYQKLLHYKQEHNGSTRVPQKYAKDPQLGRWVNEQRKNCIRKELRKLLNDIDFVWDARKDKSGTIVAPGQSIQNSSGLSRGDMKVPRF